jgi:hypothetical protein
LRGVHFTLKFQIIVKAKPSYFELGEYPLAST